ncbi:MAG: hypothetical protein AAGA68_25315 [Pseudomonadota bacterium]
MAEDPRILRTPLLLILTVFFVLLALWWRGEDSRLSTTEGTVVSVVQGDGSRPSDGTAPVPSEAADGRCEDAKTLQRRVSKLAARSVAFLASVQDTISDDLDTWPDKLAESEDPELLYVASYADQSRVHDQLTPARRVELLQRALAVDSTNPMYLTTLMHVCLRNPDAPGCDLPDLEGKLIAFDSDNGQSWALVAASCGLRGDEQCAFQAMEQGAVAPSYRDYYTERVLVTERAMAAVGISYPMRSTTAFILAALEPSTVPLLPGPCTQEAPASMHAACRAYGQRLERHGKSMLSQQAGRAVQLLASSVLGDTAPGEPKEPWKHPMAGAFDDGEPITQAVFHQRIIWDRDLFLEYVAHMQTVGEAQALTDVLAGWGTGPPECLTRPEPVTLEGFVAEED